jgi:hypothetical protein
LRLSAGDGDGKTAKICDQAASRIDGGFRPDMGGRRGGSPRLVKIVEAANGSPHRREQRRNGHAAER